MKDYLYEGENSIPTNMNIPLREVVPLEQDEKNWLMTIYTKRRYMTFRLFLALLIFCYVVLFKAFPTVLYSVITHTLPLDSYDRYPKGPTELGLNYITLVIFGFSLTISVLYYYSAVLPYKYDSLSGIKERVPFLVTYKEYFPVTGQYFVNVKGINQHYEVDADTYDNCEEGGYLIMDRAIKTRYIFCENNELI